LTAVEFAVAAHKSPGARFEPSPVAVLLQIFKVTFDWVQQFDGCCSETLLGVSFIVRADTNTHSITFNAYWVNSVPPTDLNKTWTPIRVFNVKVVAKS
jgi:hypothetical protein